LSFDEHFLKSASSHLTDEELKCTDQIRIEYLGIASKHAQIFDVPFEMRFLILKAMLIVAWQVETSFVLQVLVGLVHQICNTT
jgi:hypothetical protein